eukprot:476869-Amorphochlora_amoeboformis.AAC.1
MSSCTPSLLASLALGLCAFCYLSGPSSRSDLSSQPVGVRKALPVFSHSAAGSLSRARSARASASRGSKMAIAPPLAGKSAKQSSSYSLSGIRMEPVIKGLRSDAVVRAVRDPETQKYIDPTKSLKFVATEEIDQPLFGNQK